jgi:hypothetical protein
MSPTMQLSFTLDPGEVLGVAPDASLQEIRRAYHEQAKKYHPDLGGDPWVFRVINRSYEALSAARVAGRAAEEFAASAPPAQADSPDLRHDPAAHDTERIQADLRDEVGDPTRLVDVELLLLRFPLDGPLDYLTRPADERNLSCCLNVSWPSRRPGRAPRTPGEAAPIASKLARAFAPLPRKTRAVASRSRSEEGRFDAWLSYPTAERAWAAFQVLHRALRKHGLGVDQWSREIILERGMT